MALQTDAGEDIALRRRRLRYRSWHRGTKEMDLQKWLLGQEPPPADVDHALMAELLNFRTSK